MKKFTKIFIILLVILIIPFIILNNVKTKPKKFSGNLFSMPIMYMIMDVNTPNDVNTYNAVDKYKKYRRYFIPKVNIEMVQKGNYYEAKLPKLDINDNIVDFIFTKNNLQGQKVTDCIFDKKNKIIKIPKKYYSKNQKKSQIQMEILSKVEEKKLNNKEIDVYVNNKHKKIKNYGKDIETTFSMVSSNSLNKNYLKRNISIFVNDNKIKLDESLYDYDSDTGTLRISFSPSIIEKIIIYAKKSNTYESLFLSDVNAKSYTYDKMNSAGTLDKAPGVTKGSTFTIKNVPIAYIAGDGKVYGDSTTATHFSDVEDNALYYSCKDSKCSKYTGSSDYFTAHLNSGTISSNKIDFSAGTYVKLYCDSHGSSQGVNSKMNLTVKVLYVATNYIILEFDSDENFFSQYPSGVLKFKWDNQIGTISVKKYLYNNGTRDQETTKNGTFGFKIFDDATDCANNTDAIQKEKFTNDNSNVNFTKLDFGTYYVRETTCDVTKYHCDTSCHSVTLNSNSYYNATDKVYQEVATLKYNVDKDGNYASDANNPIKNYFKHYCFSVKKESSLPGSDVSNITFTDSTGATGTTTAANPVVTFGPYLYGTYSYRETSTNSEHYNDNSNWTTAQLYEAAYTDPVNKTGPYCTGAPYSIATDEHIKYCTRIIKKDATSMKVIRSKTSLCDEAQRNGQLNSNYGTIDCNTIASTGKVSDKKATFNLCTDSACNNVIQSGITTNEFGIATISDLTSVQDYYVKETIAPDGYTSSNTVTKIPKEQLHEQYANYSTYCTNLLSESTSNYKFTSPNYTEKPNATSYSNNLNVYIFRPSDSSLDFYSYITDAVGEVNDSIEEENRMWERTCGDDCTDDMFNNTKINVKILDLSRDDNKSILETAISNLPGYNKSGFYTRENNEQTLISGPFIIVGNNVFVYNSTAQINSYSDYYNLYRLKDVSTYDDFSSTTDTNINNKIKSFFKSYLSDVTDDFPHYQSSTYNFTYNAGQYISRNVNAYYDLINAPGQTRFLNSNANSSFKIYVLTQLNDTEFVNTLNNSNNEGIVYSQYGEQKAVIACLKKAINKLNDEVKLTTSSSSSIFSPVNIIQNVNLTDITQSNGINFYNYDLYPKIGNALSSSSYFDVRTTNYGSPYPLIDYSFPIMYMNNKAYYYDDSYSSIGRAVNYWRYTTKDEYSHGGMSSFDESLLTNYFYKELRKLAVSTGASDSIASLLEQVGAFVSIRTPIGYNAILDGTSEYAKQETYDGMDASGFLRSIPVYNYKYKLNWYKETENGTKAAGAKFTVAKNSALIHHTGANNKTSVTDDNGVTKTCYMYSTNASDPTEFESDSNGEVCINGLEEGSYVVTETKPAAYHTFDQKKQITLTAKETFDSISTSNKFVNYQTKFEFTKSTSNDVADRALTTTISVKLPDGTTGNVNYYDLTTKELMKIPFRVYVKGNSAALIFRLDSDGVYRYAGNTIDGPAADNRVTDLYLNNSRKINIEHLPIGTYEIKEVDTQGCTGNNCENCKGFYYPEYDKISYEFTISDTYNSKATASLNNINTEINFTKNDIYSYIDTNDKVNFEDIEEVKAFDSITFKIKDENNTYLKLQKIGDYGDCNTTSGYSLYRYVSSDKGDGTGTGLHTCGGNMKITHLCRDTKYTIEEVEVPKGTVFTLPSVHPSVTYTIPKVGNVTINSNNKQTISDTPTRIVIHKKDDRDTTNDIYESDERKETAIFEVYRCTNLNAKCTYNTSTKEAIKFYNLNYIPNDREDPNERVYKYIPTSELNNVTNAVTRLTLNEKGRIILRYLPGGFKYVVLEKNAPDGYYNLEGENAEIEVFNNSSTVNNSYNFTNIHTQIKFIKEDIYKYYKEYDLDKVGSLNEIFDTMTFKLRDENGNIVKLSKVQDGEYRFIQQNGKYSTNTVENLHTKDGVFVITHLYRNETYYIEEVKTDTLGNFILPNNINNTSLVEDKAGSLKNNKHPIVKYKIPNTVPSEVEKKSLTQLVENIPSRVVFEKVDAVTGEIIDDALNTSNDPTDEGERYKDVYTTFNVYRCSKSVSTCTVDNGELIYFAEREYITDLTNDITDITPPVYVYKYSKLNSSDNKVSDLHTDRGLLILAYLPTDFKYVLYEKIAPNGYYNPTVIEGQTEFTVKDTTLENDITYESLTTKVENEPTKIIFKKKDMYDYYEKDDLDKINSEVKIFDSMRFVLRNKEGEILNLKCTENGIITNSSANNCKTGEYRYLPYKDTENLTSSLQTIDGTFKVTHLYRGETYYIEEIKEDTEGDFILPDYLNFSNLPFDNKGHPVVKYILPENEPTDDAITMVMENTPSRVIFQKRDSKYNYLIPDETTTFNVYQCSNEVEKCTPDEESAKLMYFKPRSVINNDNEDAGKEVYRYSKLNSSEGAVKDLHPYLGELILRYLPTKYKYVLVETIAPKNYTMPTGINAYTYFKISETKVDVDQIDVPNKPTSVVLRKYDEKGNLLTGAKFKVYKKTAKDGETTSCNKNLKAMDQVMEPLKLKTIYEGIYEARETTDTDIITTCSNKEKNCNELTGTLTYEKYVDDWLGLNKESNPATLKEGNTNLLNEFNDEVETYTEITEGEALIQYLEYNHCYIFEEVEAPKGYSLPEKKEDRFTMLEIKENDTFDHTTYKTFINLPTPYQFYKYDEFNQLLDGAKFKLQKLNKEKIYEDVTVSEDFDKEEDNSKVYKVDPNTDNTLIETYQGTAIIYYLEQGQYRVVETEAPAGKILGKTLNVATFFVNEKGEVYGNRIITNKKITTKIKRKNSDKAELIVNIRTGQTLIRYGLIITVIISLITIFMILRKRILNK